MWSVYASTLRRLLICGGSVALDLAEAATDRDASSGFVKIPRSYRLASRKEMLTTPSGFIRGDVHSINVANLECHDR